MDGRLHWHRTAQELLLARMNAMFVRERGEWGEPVPGDPMGLQTRVAALASALLGRRDEQQAEAERGATDQRPQ